MAGTGQDRNLKISVDLNYFPQTETRKKEKVKVADPKNSHLVK